MAFTTSDLTNIEAAIVSLSTGDAVIQVSIADKLIRYREQDYDKLITLRALMQRELGVVQPRAYAKQGGRSKT